MIIPFTRSSSLGQISMCEHAYFLVYNLGMDNPPNVKTQQGTAAHKVLECLAIGKKYIQDNPKCKQVVINDDALDELTYDMSAWNEKRQLSELDIAKINSTRVNKDTYKYNVDLSGEVWRRGESVVNDLIERSIQVFSNDNWKPVDKKNVHNYVWIVLENEKFDPRNQNIVQPERHFQIDIDREWAKYEYEWDGQIHRGTYGIKGTMDLTIQLDENTIEIIDYKTGQRKDWANDKVKEYEDLCKDKQLMLYYYAASQLYPNKTIIITIFFIRDGGPFTICFEPHHIFEMEEILKKHYLEVSANQFPKMRSPKQTDFQCNKLCYFYKNKQPGSDKNICQFIHDEIEKVGLDEVTTKFKKEGFNPSYYHCPGNIT